MFYLIVFFSVLVPYIYRNKRGLVIAMILLFFLWGLEYQLPIDWTVNLHRWEYVNYKPALVSYLEPLYKLLLRLSCPIGFFGWLMLSACYALCVFYMFIRKYVPPRYYWVSLFIIVFVSRISLAMINSNRQTVAIITVLVAVLILIRNIEAQRRTSKELMLSIILMFSATQIHSSAWGAFPLLVLPLFCSFFMRKKKIFWFIGINTLFILSYVSSLSQYTDELMELQNIVFHEGAVEYSEMAFQTAEVSRSIPEAIMSFIILNSILLYYDKANMVQQIFCLYSLVPLVMNGFLTGHAERVLYYYIPSTFVCIPNIILLSSSIHSKKSHKLCRTILASYCIAYTLFLFWSQIHQDHYSNWLNYKTIFSAPVWM